MTVSVTQVSHGSNRQRAQRIIIGDGLGDILLHHELMRAVDGTLPVVAHIYRGTLGHRSAIGIGQGALGLTARRDLLPKFAVSLLALLESLDLRRPLFAGRLMDTGFLAISGIQIAPVWRALLIDVLERLLKLCLG